MGGISLTDSELKIMNAIWREGGAAPAKIIYDRVSDETGYKRSTVYALIHRLIEKGVVKREDPDFICTALIDQSEYQKSEVKSIVQRLFGGSAERLAATLVTSEHISPQKLAELIELAESDETP